MQREYQLHLKWVLGKDDCGDSSSLLLSNAVHPQKPVPNLQLPKMYSPQMLDHFQNPRNAGRIENADAEVQIENPACGDVLELTAKAAEGRLREVRFRAKGCVPAMACGSALTELLQGRTLEEARQLHRDELIGKVGGLPEASAHASYLAMDALKALLNKL